MDHPHPCQLHLSLSLSYELHRHYFAIGKGAIDIAGTMRTSPYFFSACNKEAGIHWVESIGVANKDAVFAMLVGLAKQFEASF